MICQGLAFAQDGNYAAGARSVGLGNASVTLGDEWALFNNIAGVAHQKKLSAVAAFDNKYNFAAFSTVAAGINVPTKWGTLSASAFRFGDALFSNSKVGLGFANTIGFMSLGVQVNYLQYAVQNVGNRSMIVVDFGGQAEINPQLIFGAHIFNVNQATISKETGERVPTLMKAGLSYRPSKKLMLNIETLKDVDQKASVNAGIEYKVMDKLPIRTGVNTFPFSQHFGLGFQPSLFNIDYALTNYSDGLGLSHSFSVSFSLDKSR